MTDEDKDILIMKMIDDPASLSENEIETILNDGELHDIYETSSSIGGAYAASREFNAASEWALFRQRVRKKPPVWRRVMRIAAILLGIAAVSGFLTTIFDHSHEDDSTDFYTRAELPETVISDEIDIEEYLRIQKARIDNDIAMLNAEMYEELHQRSVDDIDSDYEMENEIILTSN